ncbi:FAD-dependent oxidoreductase [Acetobacterium bakii]|uniref:Pyridine nucleotide-disulfide oxidoreductase n=1 Tax=Acetobacterium bakii TaxID=52689 RepID=A0A0L6U4E8_9FIRM|nr:FAD-dependent oxidoreductase [Acetobacterium bakii]KNZ43381.1 pyridine nucleotide-disulfide oxidoreductase [Acetobacterium bakii]
MGKKVLIVGGVAGGASVAARVRRLDESAEVIIFEKGPNVSFSNCCLPNHLSGMIENSEDLVLMCPTNFKKQYNIEARINNEVLKINKDKKTILVKDLLLGKEYEESYDTLFLSPGANPIVPKIEGYDKANVFTVKNVVDIDKLNKFVQNGVKDIVVVGGGFIGVEVAENLKLSPAGFKVTLVEQADQIMAPFDYDMVQILHKELLDNGVDLIVGDGIAKVTDGFVELASGKKIQAQAVVMAIGVTPDTKLAVAAGLEIGETRGILVDHNYRTSDKNIYAVGDAIEVYHQLTHSKTKLALAGPAQKQARAAADNMFGIPVHNIGIIGSSCIKIFEMNAASTGLTEKAAQKAGIQYDSVYIIPGDIVGIMPGNSQFFFKLVYEVPTGKVLGAQAISRGDATKRVDVIATMITMGGTLEDLKELELCYAPAFSTAKDPVNFAALVALNLLNGEFKQVPVTQVRELVENDAFIIDVREPNEYEKSHLLNAVNIPLSQFRQRLDEIPKDQPVYAHCRSGQRSYNMVRALGQLGFNNIWNISGSYLGICFYEYFNDKAQGRKPIVTDYNLN